MLASIIDDSVITCDNIRDTDAEAKSNDKAKSNDDETKINFDKKKGTCKTQNFYILIAFLLITIALLIAVSNYCYLRKYQAKQKYLPPFHFTNDKLKT